MGGIEAIIEASQASTGLLWPRAACVPIEAGRRVGRSRRLRRRRTRGMASPTTFSWPHRAASTPSSTVSPKTC